MAKGHREPRQSGLFPETYAIAALLSKESSQDLVVLVVPSHDRKDKALGDALMSEWASNAMKLLADLYRGATAYQAAHGIFKTDEGHYLHDKPMVLEAFAEIEAIHDVNRLNLLVEFCKRMGKTLDQAAIMVAFGNIMYYIEDYSGV
jgi:hypothetical protein